MKSAHVRMVLLAILLLISLVAVSCSVQINSPVATLAITTSTPSPSPSPSPVAGLIGWWRLNEGSGTAVADSSGFGHDGTLMGGSTWTSGYYESAVNFSENNPQYVDVGTKVYATQASAFSFSAWANITDYSFSIAPAIMQLASDTPNSWYVLFSNDSRYLGISIGSYDTWLSIKTENQPTSGTWHHVAVVYNGNGPGTISNFTIYLDGVSQSLYPGNGYGSNGAPQVDWIGAGDTGGGNQWNGSIEDVRIYDRALTATEVQFIMENPGI